ncbi:site-specific integrase [Paraherbaspirillum soli]|uniref:Tyrosine recombinase XerC n=1 Tax=Paraherbaspirillum soli TaxID=631222 RepID=A0ABW0M3P2_9BURK
MLDRHKSQTKTSTHDGYRKITDNKLIPWFGELRVADIRKSHVRDQLKSRDVSNKTLANIQSVLRKALDDAVEDEIIDSNPLAGWCYSKVEAPKEDDDVDPFTIDEQAIILKNLDGQGRHLIQFAFWTGMRTSEFVALDWTDIDFVRGVAYVSKALTQQSDAPEKPKTVAGKRGVKLLRPALEALEAQKAFTFLRDKEIFQNPNTGERWTGDQPIRKTLWAHALKRGGVRYRKPYQTRHTYASMMLSAGEHPMWVAKQMGHADWTMITRVYGRWMPDADPTAGDRAEKQFDPTKQTLKTGTGGG